MEKSLQFLSFSSETECRQLEWKQKKIDENLSIMEDDAFKIKEKYRVKSHEQEVRKT
jgi:hypothetical protein